MKSPLRSITRASHALGCEVSITALHKSASTIETALDAAFAEINCVERVMSIYDPDSQLSFLNRHGMLIDPHPYLVLALAESREMSRHSNGAFDVTVQPLWNLYSTCQKVGRLPSLEELQSAKEIVNWRRISITPAQIRLLDPGMAIRAKSFDQNRR